MKPKTGNSATEKLGMPSIPLRAVATEVTEEFKIRFAWFSAVAKRVTK